MKYNTFLFILISSLALTSCNTNERIQQKLLAEVMVIHDAVMPKMDDIHKLQKQLRAVKTDLKDEAKIQDINQHIQDLENAGEGMMDWMAGLNLPSDKDTRTHEEIMAYLEQEKVNIQKVSDDMLNSIAAAEGLLSD